MKWVSFPARDEMRGCALRTENMSVVPGNIGKRLGSVEHYSFNRRDGSLMRFQKADNAISHISTVMQYKTL